MACFVPCFFSSCTPRGSGVIVTNDQEGGRDPNNIIISGILAYNNKHAGIHVKHSEHVVIAQSICSQHDHVAVSNQGQRYGIHVYLGGNDLVIERNITHSNTELGILLESENAQPGE